MSFAIPAIPSPYIHVAVKRRKTTWYSIKDGNWTDRNIWLSNALRRWDYPYQTNLNQNQNPIFPQVGDDVYINHTVTLNTSAIVNNLYISGTFKADNLTRGFYVYGDIQATGTVDFTSSNVSMLLYGVNNFINTFISGTASTVIYATYVWDQNIMDLSYQNLTTLNGGTKYFVANNTVKGNLSIYANTKIGIYDLTVNGTSLVFAKLSKTGSGNVLFIGLLTVANTPTTYVDFTGGNPSVECRGGITCGSNFYNNILTGTGTWTFTTNNQNLTPGNASPLIFDGNVLISGAITVTINTAYSNGVFVRFNQSVNGDNASSTLSNLGGAFFANTSPVIMTTGIFTDGTTVANTAIGYIMNGNYTIPKTTFKTLVYDGTGIKTLSGDTTVNEILTSNSGSFGSGGVGKLECSTFSLSVIGATNIGGGYIYKNSATGSILFTGLLTTGTGTGLDLSVGNPNVEFRGGILFGSNSGNSSGTGTWTFSTNNQTVTNVPQITINAIMLISGAITVTTVVNSGQLIFLTNTIDGNNASSKLDNRGLISYSSVTQPMVTGLLETDAAANTWKYNKTGNQDVKGGTYRIIEFGGSGNKTLQGNVIVNVTAGGSQSTTGSAVVVLNGFTITTI